VAGDERTTHRGYAYNTSAWILDKIAWERVYEGISEDVGGAAPQTETRFYYDGASSFMAPPAKGLLTRVDRGKEGWGWMSEQAAYDAYGNPTVLTDARGFTTTFGYDPSGVYRVWERNALGHLTQYEYYGIHESDLGAGRGPVGALKRVMDPNGAAIAYTYDPFGRLRTVARPGDTWDFPTEEWRYYDGVDFPFTDRGPLMVVRLVRGTPGLAWCSGGLAFWERLYYDGLGRRVERQTPGPGWTCSGGGQEIVQYTRYDALGRVAEESLPYFVPQYTYATTPDGKVVTPYRNPDPYALRVRTQYDALGRAVRVVNPDGTDTTTVYNGWSVSRLDGNSHYRSSRVDAFGRLVQVDETLATLEEPFATMDTARWVFSGHQTLEGGGLKNSGAGNSYDANFYRSAYNITGGQYGQGIKVEFRVDGNDTLAHFALEASGSPYRRFGVIAGANKIYVQYNIGNGWVYPADLINPIEVGAWYVLTLKVSPSGWSFIEVWRKDDPSKRGAYRLQMPAGLSYRFRHWIYRGNAWLDDYQEWDVQTTLYAYDALGNLTRVTDAAGNITTITYDPLGRKTGMTDPDMGAWQYRYDAAGNLVKQRDARNQAICFYYDALNRLEGKSYHSGISNLDAFSCPGLSAASVRYTYDAYTPPSNYGRGQRTGMSDSSGFTAWFYDARGRVIREEKTVAGIGTFVTQYTYDAADRVASMTYPDGEVVRTTYNAQGLPSQLRSETYGVNYAANVAYNALGRITALPLGNGLTTYYTYDRFNFRLRRIQTGSLLDLRYGYDRAGNVTAIYDGTRAETLRFAYDSLDRLIRFEAAPTPLRTITIRAKGSNADGWPLMQLRVNGVVVAEWTVNSTSYADYTVQAPLAGDDQVDVAFVNDYCVPSGCTNGDRNLWVDYIVVNGQTIQAESSQVRYDRGAGEAAYDGRDVIPGQEGMYWNGALRVRVMTGSPWATQEGYAYDAIGNILYKTGMGTYAYLGGKPHAVTHINNTQQYWYDANGNMTRRVENGVVYTQTFDAENRLVAVTTPTGTIQFHYDGDGNRVLRIGPEGTTVYIGDYYEQTGSTVRKYYYAAGQRMAMRVGGALYFLHGDHLGSATLTTDGGGNGVGAIRYRPYGERRPGYPLGAMVTDRLYTGQRWEANLGLYDYRARFYDSTLGRFLQPDPIVPEPGNPQALNRYAYVYSNPLRYTDPSGRWVETVWDVANLLWDVREVWRDPRNPWNWAALVVDVGTTLLPGVPAFAGAVQKGGQVFRHADEAAQAGRIILQYGNQVVDIARLGSRAGDFLRVAHLPGAERLLANLMSASSTTLKGAEFELEFAVKHTSEIEEIERLLEVIQGGEKRIDFMLKGNIFVNVKNIDWSKYNNYVLKWEIDELVKEAKSFFKYNPSAVKYVFKGGVPDNVRQALEAAGIIVEVIP
jgi:RHS repeat-associated protein